MDISFLHFGIIILFSILGFILGFYEIKLNKYFNGFIFGIIGSFLGFFIYYLGLLFFTVILFFIIFILLIALFGKSKVIIKKKNIKIIN